MMRLDFAKPTFHLFLLPGEVLIGVAFLAGVFDPNGLIESRTRNRDAVIRARKSQLRAEPAMLQKRHVARGAEGSEGIRFVVRVQVGRKRLSGATARAWS